MINAKVIFGAILILALVILMFFLTRKTFHAKFYNKTGKAIDSLSIGENFIGHLANNDSTNFIDFKKFKFDSGYPYETIKGIIDDKKFQQIDWSWCGTERKYETRGSYFFDIKIIKGGDTVDRLYLVKHGDTLFNWH